jgi:hypothetical protein
VSKEFAFERAFVDPPKQGHWQRVAKYLKQNPTEPGEFFLVLENTPDTNNYPATTLRKLGCEVVVRRVAPGVARHDVWARWPGEEEA